MNKLIIAVFASALMMSACSRTWEHTADDRIRLDQCGYMPNAEKMAFVVAPANHFSIVTPDGTTIYSAAVQPADAWQAAGDTLHRIVFTDVTAEGTYYIVVDDTIVSHPVEIKAKPYSDVLKLAAKAYYYNRMSMPIDSVHGGKWARAAGHPDTVIAVHTSAASEARPKGTVLSMPGGWYDAGDYNKYIVNSSISVYTMMLAAKMFPAVADTMDLNIPESGNNLPDYIDEILYNLRWMLSMQDPNDGGVYHKLTTLEFEGFIMPDECTNQRYVVAKSTAAALDLAATAAFACRFLPTVGEELKPLADSCLNVATAAYEWARANPNVIYRNPIGVTTGEYGDETLTDEWFWAATEMWLATGNESYAADAVANKGNYGVPEWAKIGLLGNISLCVEGKEINGLKSQLQLLSLADSLVSLAANSPVNLSMQYYDWGSNSFVANEGMVKLLAYKLSGDDRYYKSAMDDLHYLLGRNATGYCFVTGAGSKSPMRIHHRPSAADGIDEPIPGLLVGGPNVVVPTDCGPETRSQYPAKAYADEECSYSTNEVAINWNAPFIFLLLGIING